MINTYITGSKIFIDTGAFIALVFKKDDNHEKAKSIFHEIGNKYLQITSNLVISETYTYLRYHVNYHTAIGFLRQAKKAENSGFLKVIYSDKKIENRALEILEKYNDQDFSYTDAVSFSIILNDGKIKDVFTFDHHFFIVGCHIITT